MAKLWRFFSQALFVCLIAVLLAPTAEAKRPGKKNEKKPLTTAEKVALARKYAHPCPAGTEQYGTPPPQGARIYCRQPLNNGGFRKHGTMTEYYANGTKRVEGDYDRDKRFGVWTEYYRTGVKKEVKEYDYEGKIVKKTEFTPRGATKVKKDRKEELAKKREAEQWRYDDGGKPPQAKKKKHEKKNQWYVKTLSERQTKNFH